MAGWPTPYMPPSFRETIGLAWNVTPATPAGLIVAKVLFWVTAMPLPSPAPDSPPGAVHLPDALLEQPATAAPAARPTPETRTVRRFSINVPPGEERY